ncbi:MAG: fibronectin type III domain-containing protein [Acidobacteriota bacterium]
MKSKKTPVRLVPSKVIAGAALILVGLALSLPLTRAQSYFYDDAGRLTQVAYPQGVGIRYTYDDADNLTAVTPLNLPPAPVIISVTRTSPAAAALVWQDASNRETGYLIQRRSADNLLWETVATVGANTTSFTDTGLDPNSDYVYRIVAQGSGGYSAYSGEYSPEAAGPAGSSVSLAIDSLGANTTSTLGSAGPAEPGYATVTVNSGATPYGTAVFGLSQNGVVVSEAGVPASPPTSNSRIFIDFRTQVHAHSNEYQGTIEINTGLAVVNTGSTAASISYTLRNTSGQVVSSGTGTLEAGAHFAKFINQLRDVAPNFVLPSNFASAVQFGTLDLSSDQPLSVLALRLTTNQRGEALLTTTPAADLTQPAASGSLYLPQFVDGQGSTSSLILLNTTGNALTGTIRLFDQDGAPLQVRQVGGALSSVFAYSISANGAYVLQTDGSSPTVTVGWVLLTPDPGSSAPIGGGVFQLSQNGRVVTESGVPAAPLTTRARIYVDTTQGHNTGLAIANPGGSDMQVAVSAFTDDGTTPAGAENPPPIQLKARGQNARFVTELVSGLPANFTGVLDLQSTTPFAALTLRSLFNSRGDFLLTTFPIADLTRPAPDPVVFPQIADGGGIRTQFILINPSTNSVINIRFFDEQGTPLAIGTP